MSNHGAPLAPDYRDHLIIVMAHALRALAEGDLTCRVREGLPGDGAVLGSDFNQAVESLEDAVAHVLSLADGVGRSSAHFSAAITLLAERTSRQAVSVEESAASLLQARASMNRANATGGQLLDNFRTSGAGAGRWRHELSETVLVMQAAKADARRLTDAINVISNITFQTNLLAINAGIEASRAGDSGRGFAIVAIEMRELARRTAEAIQAIRTLVDKVEGQITLGATRAGSAGEGMTGIAEAADKLGALMESMSTASMEQAMSLEQVSVALEDIDLMTQENALMVQTCAATVRNMGEYSVMLTGITSAFRIGYTNAAEAPGVQSGQSGQPAPDAA